MNCWPMPLGVRRRLSTTETSDQLHNLFGLTETMDKRELYMRARRIYRLVRRGQTSQAEQELRRLGDARIPVAQAIVDDDFRTEPVGRTMKWLALAAEVPILWIAWRFVGPLLLEGSIAYKIMYFSAFAASFLLANIGLVIAFSSIWAAFESLSPGGLTHGHLRARDIAATSIASAATKQSDLLGPLLSAMYRYNSPNEPVRDELDLALINTLKACDINDFISLKGTQGVALRHRLNLVRTLADDLADGKELDQWSALCKQISPQIGLQILRVYEIYADRGAIPFVARLTEPLNEDPHGEDWKAVREAAIRCLPILRANVEALEGNQHLLRGAEAPAAKAEEMLRPASVGHQGNDDKDELLRPE